MSIETTRRYESGIRQEPKIYKCGPVLGMEGVKDLIRDPISKKGREALSWRIDDCIKVRHGMEGDAPHEPRYTINMPFAKGTDLDEICKAEERYSSEVGVAFISMQERGRMRVVAISAHLGSSENWITRSVFREYVTDMVLRNYEKISRDAPFLEAR